MRTRPIRAGIAVALASALVSLPASAQQALPPLLPPPAQPAPPPSASPPSPVPAPTPMQLAERRVRVDVDSTRDAAVVERRISSEEGHGNYFFVPYNTTNATWEQVCVTPCHVDLDRYSSYRVATMNGIARSRTFTLPQSGDDLRLQVQAGDNTWHRLGGALTGAGVAATIVGVVLIAAAHAFTNESQVRVAGFITGGSGLAVMAVGIPLSLATSTRVFTLGKRIAVTPRGLTF